mmetsp:Transcript_32850/g.77003  ORF Transcript_32850/g.77003 Transcript_32850/m.77003 type:complete len:201 (-) Transcript_32850:36-638(-)
MPTAQAFARLLQGPDPWLCLNLSLQAIQVGAIGSGWFGCCAKNGAYALGSRHVATALGHSLLPAAAPPSSRIFLPLCERFLRSCPNHSTKSSTQSNQEHDQLSAPSSEPPDRPILPSFVPPVLPILPPGLLVPLRAWHSTFPLGASALSPQVQDGTPAAFWPSPWRWPLHAHPSSWLLSGAPPSRKHLPARSPALAATLP